MTFGRIAKHPCPGDCGRTVADHLFACRSCWYRLPGDIRLGISSNYRRNPDAHATFVAEAVEWYAENGGAS